MRHSDIAEHGIEPARTEHFKSHRPIGRGYHVMPVAHQRLLQHRDDFRLVIHHQHFAAPALPGGWKACRHIPFHPA